jgi:hypothetical protein
MLPIRHNNNFATFHQISNPRRSTRADQKNYFCVERESEYKFYIERTKIRSALSTPHINNMSYTKLLYGASVSIASKINDFDACTCQNPAYSAKFFSSPLTTATTTTTAQIF